MTLFYINMVSGIALATLFVWGLYRAEMRLQNIERQINNTQEKYTNPEK